MSFRNMLNKVKHFRVRVSRQARFRRAKTWLASFLLLDSNNKESKRKYNRYLF